MDEERFTMKPGDRVTIARANKKQRPISGHVEAVVSQDGIAAYRIVGPDIDRLLKGRKRG